MNEFLQSVQPTLEALQPYIEVVAWLAFSVLLGVVENAKGRAAKVAQKAVAETEAAFAGAYKKSTEKKDHAVGLIARQFRFLPESYIIKIMEEARTSAQVYADAYSNKMLDKVEQAVEVWEDFPNEKRN